MQACRQRSGREDGAGNVRQPDVTVERGRGAGGDLEATEPKALFQVLSPSTRRFDLVPEADEYQQIESLAHFVMLEPDRPEAIIWSRAEGQACLATRLVGAEAELDLGVALPLAELNEDVEISAGQPPSSPRWRPTSGRRRRRR